MRWPLNRSLKILGITLRWRHISLLAITLVTVEGLQSHESLTWGISTETLVSTYKAIVRPIINFATPIWYTHVSLKIITGCHQEAVLKKANTPHPARLRAKKKRNQNQSAMDADWQTVRDLPETERPGGVPPTYSQRTWSRGCVGSTPPGRSVPGGSLTVCQSASIPDWFLFLPFQATHH